jgi:RHS repeat-associated protein
MNNKNLKGFLKLNNLISLHSFSSQKSLCDQVYSKMFKIDVYKLIPKICLFGLCFIVNQAVAQQQLILNSYSGESSIKARQSITLTDGFFVPSGSNLRIYTDNTYINCQPLSVSPTITSNYILTKSFREAGVSVFNVNQQRDICQENQAIQYLDGFGRIIQNIQVQASPGFNDIVQPIVYDAVGREDKKYLPYVAIGTHGAYRPLALNDQLSFYTFSGTQSGEQMTNGIVRIPTPFSQTVFEASPLSRVLEQGAPGDAWKIDSGHTQKTEYLTNQDNEVRLWTLNSAENGANSSFYPAGKLYKTIIKDENWIVNDGKAGTTEEFKDMEDHVVLKRVWETNSKSLSTYYLFDDLGNLRYVLPPAVNENGINLISSFDETQPVFDQFIYAYHYDERKRMIEKKIPGKGWEELIYNPINQIIMTRDAVQATRNERIFNKYDALGRLIMSGIVTGQNSLRIDVQNNINAQVTFFENRDYTSGNYHGYTNQTLPVNTVEMQPNAVNFYDNYDIPGLPFTVPAGYSAMTTGLLTATKVKVLGTADQFLWTLNLYDDQGRLTKILKQHFLSGVTNATNFDEIDNSYSFTGELLSSNKIHHTTGSATSIISRYEYDHVGRKLATFSKTNNQDEVALSHLEYNEIGQLKSRMLHNDLQTTNFAYNERGWIKSSSSNEFSMQLKYQEGTVPQWNGNIANQQWGAASNFTNVFTYSYDKLNRLIFGISTGITMSEAFTYDVMGNIKTLDRDGTGAKVYNYNGNQLSSVNGLTNSYSYDENGNAITDGRNGMSLTYNYLNLPTTANKTGTNLIYTYDVAGNKLAKTYNGTVRNYVGGIEYNGNTIDIIHTEEGVAQNNGGTYTYQYNLSDHLGNVRYTFDIYNGAVRKLQSDDYYVFGKRKSSGSPISLNNKYLYNGKEIQDELDGQYDYGARFYDPEIGRWNVLDPLAEKAHSVNPYAYTDNNPVNNVDPNGMETLYGLAAQNAFRQLQSQYSSRPPDDYTLKEDGTVTLSKRTNTKSNRFFNEKGVFLFGFGEDVSPRSDWKNLSLDFQKEIAWSVGKISLRFATSPDLTYEMSSRAEINGWDASNGINEMIRLGKEYNSVLKSDVISELSGIDYLPSQSMREGKPQSVIGLINKNIKRLDAIYPILTNGRDLQYDVTHPINAASAYKQANSQYWSDLVYKIKTGIVNLQYGIFR